MCFKSLPLSVNCEPHVSRVVFIYGMSTNVPHQIFPRCTLEMACFTFIRCFSGVSTHVYIQLTILCKLGSTCFAFECGSPV